MAFLSAIPISRKLPAIIVALCLTASLSIAVVSYSDFKRNILHEAQKSFSILTESRTSAVASWLENLEGEVSALGADPTVSAAINSFTSSYNLMIDSAGLQLAYVTNNPNPIGEKDMLDQAPESIPYHFQHGQFHPYLRQIKDTEGYYDIFLFNLDGDLIYSVFKELDYATNFLAGPYRDTGLAEAFASAKEGTAGQIYFADYAPYSPRNDAPASFLATPVTGTSGQVIGVVAVQISSLEINEIVNNPNGLGQSGEIYLVGPDLLTRSASRFDGGHDVLANVEGLQQASGVFKQERKTAIEGLGINGDVVLVESLQFDVFDQQWGIVGEIDRAEVNVPAIATRNKMIILTIGVALMSTFVGWIIARSFVKPLGLLGGAMQQVAKKHYDVKFAHQDRSDEIGELLQILVQLIERLRASDAAEEERRLLQSEQEAVVARLSKALDQLADGDLTRQIVTPFGGDYDTLRQNYNRTIANLNETLGTIVSRAGNIRQRSQDMSVASDELSRRTENQAATLEETAAALDELTASVRSAADGARKVESVVTDARKDAKASEPVVQSAVDAMKEIETSSDEISKIIGVIDDIAFQTNLLALNAGVEAARAGEAGRGFAVVASEVRALAQRSSDAAKQIKTLISDSAGQVSKGVDLVGQAGGVLTKIAAHIGNISELMSDIASGAQEQSVGLGEINIGVTQLDKVTQQNAAMVEQQTANSHALNKNAGDLTEMMRRFKMPQANNMQADRPDSIESFRPRMMQS